MVNQNVKDVIDILRRDVPMPWIYPKSVNKTLRWMIEGNYFDQPICPLGLHPLALEKIPYLLNHFLEDIFT